MLRAAAAGVFALTSLALVLALAHRLDSVPEGLHASYFSTVDWSSAPVRSVVDPTPSTESLIAAWNHEPPATFSATWSGSFIVFQDDDYTFATDSDDGSMVYVDGRLVVENGGHHEARLARGTIRLARGVHAVFLEYFQDGGDMRFELQWAHSGAPLASVPSWRLTTRQQTFARMLASVGIRRARVVVEWLDVVAVLLLIALTLRAGVTALAAHVGRDPAFQALAAVVVGSLILDVVGLSWGLPGPSWAGDEMSPGFVMNGLAQHFSNGWWDRWPPVHYYVLAVAYSPVLFLDYLGLINLTGGVAYTTLTVVGRLVSVAAACGTLVAVYACGARAYSKRAGVFAALALALAAPLVYYAKVANVDGPWLFWFAVSLVWYLRMLDTLTERDIAVFAACAALAIGTKDQAYGLYLSAPFAFVYALWSSNRRRNVLRPLVSALTDRRLIVGALAGAIVFVICDNVLFNFSGFVSHVRYITGPGSQSYRIFDTGVAGRLRLLALSSRLDEQSWGWPLTVLSFAGLAAALADRATRRTTTVLVAMAVSYYLGFINVILYNYDRYLLPICVIQTLFIGVAIDRLLASRGPAPAWRPVAVGGVFAYSLLYAGTVDAVMIHDSRYAADAWLRGHASARDTVGTVFPAEYRPHTYGLTQLDIGTIAQLRRDTPKYYVLNADYGLTVRPGSETEKLIAGLRGGSLGYTLAFRYRSPSPWPWLPGAHPDLVGPRLDPLVFSFLRNINPTIEIYQR